MQHVPLQFWQRWAELKANGFDYEHVLQDADSDAASVDDWVNVAHSDSAHTGVAATSMGPSHSTGRVDIRSATRTTQASHTSSSYPSQLSVDRLRRITGLSLPPTSGVANVAEARMLKELAPRVLPMSQLMDRRGMHALEDLDQLRQRLSRVRSTLQEADRAQLAQTLDADVLWVVGLQPQEKQHTAPADSDGDEEDDDEVPMFDGAPLDSLAGDTPAVERSPSELALRHVALARAAAVLARAGQQQHRDGPTAEFRRHFLVMMQQDLETLDWFGEGQIGTLENEEHKHEDTLRVLRRAGVNVRGMQHNTALDGAVPVATAVKGGHARTAPPPFGPVHQSQSVTMSRSVTDLVPDEDFMGPAAHTKDAESVASGDTRSVTAGGDRLSEESHHDDESGGVTRLRFPSTVPRRVRVMLQGLRPAEREAYQTRVRNLYAQEMRSLFRHFNCARRKANKAQVFSNEVNMARAMAKASLPAAALGGVLLPAVLLRDLVLRDVYLRFQVRDFVLDTKFRNADSTLALSAVMQELPHKCASLFRQVAHLFPWLEAVIPVKDGVFGGTYHSREVARARAKQESSSDLNGQQPAVTVRFDMADGSVLAASNTADEHKTEAPQVKAQTGEDVMLQHLAALGVSVASTSSKRDQQLRRDVSREFVARAKSARWLITGAYGEAVRKMDFAGRRRIGAMSGRLHTAGSARRGGRGLGAVSTAAEAADDMAMAISGVGGGGQSGAAATPEVRALDALLGSPLDEGVYRPGALVRRLLRQAQAQSSAVASAVTSAAGVRRQRKGRRRMRRNKGAASPSHTPSKDVTSLAKLVQGGVDAEGGVAWRLAYNARLAASVELRSSIQPKAMVPRHLYMAPPVAGRSTAKSRGVAAAVAARATAEEESAKQALSGGRVRHDLVAPHLRSMRQQAQSKLGLPSTLRSGDGPTPAQARRAQAQQRRMQQLHGQMGGDPNKQGVAAATGVFGPSLEGVQALAGGARHRGGVTLAMHDSVQPQSAVYAPAGGGTGSAAIRRAVLPEHLTDEGEDPSAARRVRMAEDLGTAEGGGGKTVFMEAPGQSSTQGGIDATPFHIGEHVGGVHESQLGSESLTRDDAWLRRTHQGRVQAAEEAAAEAAQLGAESNTGPNTGEPKTRLPSLVCSPGSNAALGVFGEGGEQPPPRRRHRRRRTGGGARGRRGGSKGGTNATSSANVLLRALDGGTVSATGVAGDTSLARGIRGAAARVAAAQAAPAQLGDAARLQVRKWAEAGGAVFGDGGVAAVAGATPGGLGHLMLGKSASAAVGLTKDELEGWGPVGGLNDSPSSPISQQHRSPSAGGSTTRDVRDSPPFSGEAGLGLSAPPQLQMSRASSEGHLVRSSQHVHGRQLLSTAFRKGAGAGASRDALLARAALSHTALPAYLRGGHSGSTSEHGRGAAASMAAWRVEAAGVSLGAGSGSSVAAAMAAGGAGGVALAQRKRLAGRASRERTGGRGRAADAWLRGGGLPRVHLRAVLGLRPGASGK